jgi:hypothetical protein
MLHVLHALRVRNHFWFLLLFLFEFNINNLCSDIDSYSSSTGATTCTSCFANAVSAVGSDSINDCLCPPVRFILLRLFFVAQLLFNSHALALNRDIIMEVINAKPATQENIKQRPILPRVVTHAPVSISTLSFHFFSGPLLSHTPCFCLLLSTTQKNRRYIRCYNRFNDIIMFRSMSRRILVFKFISITNTKFMSTDAHYGITSRCRCERTV